MKFKAKARQIHDLGLICKGMVNQYFGKMEFKSLVKIKGIAGVLFDSVPEFDKKYTLLSDRRGDMMLELGEKIESFKAEKISEASQAGTLNDEYKKMILDFSSEQRNVVTSQIKEELQPQFDELYKGLGEEEKEFELSRTQHKILVENFEVFAKELYKNKEAMVDMYNILVTDDSSDEVSPQSEEKK